MKYPKKAAGQSRGGTTGTASAFESAGGEPIRKGEIKLA